MSELSIPQELRTAVTRLRCDHSFPCNPPGGTMWAPGPCEQCGMPWDERNPIADLPDELREPLAAWLESAAGHADKVRLPAHQAMLVDQHALAVARALNGTPVVAEQPMKTTTIVVQRACNGCDASLRDANDAELDAAMAGRPLPDVRSECPNCSPALAEAGGRS